MTLTAVPDFVCIDFETANSSRSSPIQVGLSRVVGGVARAPQVATIMPPMGKREFAPANTLVHGLTAQDIHGAPEWPEIHHRLRVYVGDLPLVAHNASFERSVIVQTSQEHAIAPEPFAYHCTLHMARTLFPKSAGILANHKLDTVAAHLGVQQLNHHDAGDDALVGANIALALMAMPGGLAAFEKALLR
ncbi:exonuclease domain-containing protein [Microbacterium sp. 77mftsu3.1]|uniref:exonuclease domain-containing protein n=1 Tax=Microbacterium sp. 77mftsu3.1 TaxID=1761802 RepID=UPI000376771E|nr:exonuclease domain-containing protein [Microbacterium sp. 77mftsu3.1]SDH49425.1 DNA polymerase-3 subunit epsilon [Microbacterium sp. 77mftsu3.1]